jgi:hypothetical protein
MRNVRLSATARVAAITAVVGATGGGAAAILIPVTQGATRSAPSTTIAAGAGTLPAPAGAPRAPVVRVAPARPEPTRAGSILLRTSGPVQIQARTPDPAGGPDWAVRVFRADRTFRAGGRVHVASRARCAQLGRIHRGRFGWLDGQGTWRPVRPSLFASPTQCGSRLPDLGGEPALEVVQPVTGATGPTPRVASTVAWGRLGTAAEDVHVTVDGRTFEGAAGADRIVLRVVRPAGGTPRAAVRLRYAGGGAKRVTAGGDPGAVLAARAADPRGGPPFGLTASRGGGGWCLGQVGRIVDSRVGSIDFRFGTFRARGPGDCARRPSADPPVVEVSGGGDLGDDPVYEEGAPAARGVARRTVPGLTWVAGRARDDVRSITFRTTHDVRTIVPQGPSRSYLVVYDGQFPSGTNEELLRFADGHTERRRLALDVY